MVLEGIGGACRGVEETRPGTEKRCSPNLRAEAAATPEIQHENKTTKILDSSS